MPEQINIREFFTPKLSSVGNNLVNRTKGDRVIWAVVVLLTLMSLLVVYSSTGSLAYKYSKSPESFLFKQLVFIIAGLLLIYFAHRVNYSIYSKVAKWLFIISVPLLIYTLFFGTKLNEGSRWIKLPVINMTFQTSDLAKLALFMFISRQLSRSQNHIKDFKKGFLPLIIPVGIVCVLIAPANLSTVLLIGSTSLLLLFIGRVKGTHILLVIAASAIPIIMLVFAAMAKHKENANPNAITSTKSAPGRVGTWISRVETFMYGSKEEQSDKTYQNDQAKIAIAKGGWFGVLPGKSEQRNFLPHCYSDFVYAIIFEEYGLFGATALLLIYLLFLYRCIRLFQKCPYAFGAFLALALSFMLVIQALANMGVSVNLFPNTGVTLPLISLGGSSFLFTCLSIGIILSVARNVEQAEGKAVLATVSEEEKSE